MEKQTDYRNRLQRRAFWKKFKKMLNLGTWNNFNASFIKRKPYINIEKRAKYGR